MVDCTYKYRSDLSYQDNDEYFPTTSFFSLDIVCEKLANKHYYDINKFFKELKLESGDNAEKSFKYIFLTHTKILNFLLYKRLNIYLDVDIIKFFLNIF